MNKRVWILTIVLLLCLAASTTVTAKSEKGLPVIEQVFDPAAMIGEGAATDSGAAFRGKLYFKFWSPDTVDQVWSSPDGSRWSLAWTAGDILEGYEGMFFLTELKGQLYMSLVATDDLLPQLIVRSPDGKNWEPVASVSHGDEYSSWLCGGFTSFNGYLYAGRCYASDVFGYQARLLRSRTGDPGTWEEVATFQDWLELGSFAQYKGALYLSSFWVAGENYDEPAQIWRSEDGLSWQPVTTTGFDDPTNITIWGLGELGGYLYAGTGSFEGGDVWRTLDGAAWQPVSTDGLGDPDNLAIGFVNYQDTLLAYTINLAGGTKLYASEDGMQWQLLNEPGWVVENGTVWREAARVVFKDAVYFGLDGAGGIMKLAFP